jgi:hypothetical protein
VSSSSSRSSSSRSRSGSSSSSSRAGKREERRGSPAGWSALNGVAAGVPSVCQAGCCKAQGLAGRGECQRHTRAARRAESLLARSPRVHVYCNTCSLRQHACGWRSFSQRLSLLFSPADAEGSQLRVRADLRGACACACACACE